MKYQRKSQSSGKWKAIIITFSVIGAILLGGGLIYFLSRKKDNKFDGGINLGEQQNQQTQSAVLQLASNLLDNTNNLNQLTKKPDGAAKTISEIEEEFLISAYSPKLTPSKSSISETLSPEVIERTWWELRPWIEEYLKDLNQSILEHAREKFRRDVENWLRWQQKKEYNRQLEEYQKHFQELKKVEDLIREYQKIREQELLDKISRKTELRNKGYVDRDLEYLKEKNLLDQEIPDLNAEKRIGATSALWIQGSRPSKIGGSSDLVIFLKPNNNQKTDINFSVRISKNREDYERVIRNYLTEKGKINNVDVYVLFRTDTWIAGNSFGTAYYLAIHSLINRIPLPKNLGSTGNIQGQSVGAIGGLEQKIKYNVKKKNIKNELIPIDIYITSIENKKYEGVPEQSYDDLSPFITDKVKQVHFVSSIKELEIALNEILNETIKEKVHVCGKSEVRNKLPQDPKPKNMEFQATPEQLLALLFDSGFCGVSRNQERQQKEKGVSIPLASAELGPLQNILDIHFKQAGATEKVKNLYNEYKQKLNSDSVEEWYKNQLAQLENQSQNQKNNKTSSEKIKQIQTMIGKLRQETVQKKQNYERFKIVSEQRIAEIQKQIEGQKQAKTNEELILQKIDLDIEEAKRDPNRDTQDLERSKNEVSQRINQLTAQISASEKQITDLKQEIENRFQESSASEVQIESLELQLQELINQNKTNSSQQIQAKKQEIEQEYQRRQVETNQNVGKLYQEYETKFKETSSSLANLIPNIQKQLTELDYQKLVITWKSTNFGKIHLTTLENSVIFEVVKN